MGEELGALPGLAGGRGGAGQGGWRLVPVLGLPLGYVGAGGHLPSLHLWLLPHPLI